MTPRAAEMARRVGRLGTDRLRLDVGLSELEALYTDLIRAFVPAHSEFERERIIVALPCKREIVFIFGLYNEGENEAALLLELIAATLADDRSARVDHLLDEMSYYLRTSIDPKWQLHAPLSAAAAAVYLFAVLDERLQELLASRERRCFAFLRRRDVLIGIESELPRLPREPAPGETGEQHANGRNLTPRVS